MRQRLVFIGIWMFAIGFLYSCCKAGTGGRASIVCKVINANTGARTNNATVYIYYGSSKPPATLDKFDAHQNTPVKGNTVTFTGMKCGTYYLYAVGYDSTVSLPLKGGGPFSLAHSKRNSVENATISVSY